MVGSMIDAHPNAVISIEANAFQMLQLGYYRSAMFLFIEFWSKFVSGVLGNRWSGYNYKIGGGSQGKSQEILIIGDNDANQTSKRILRKPHLTKQIARRVGVPVKYIHVVRNPFDIITTMHNRKTGNFNKSQMKTVASGVNEELLKKKIRTFFRKAEEVERLITSQQIDALNVFHDHLILAPKETLKIITDFIEMDVSDEFLSICASTIHSSSNLSRHKIFWPEKLKREVESRCRQISFLKDYTFAS